MTRPNGWKWSLNCQNDEIGVIFVIYAQIDPQTLYTPYPIHAIIKVQQKQVTERKIMDIINDKRAFEILEATRAQGTIFRVTFVKRTTGEVRNMRARLGVKRGVTGVGMAYKPSEKNLLACYDVEKAQEMKAQGMDDETAAKKSFRMIDLNSIMNMTVSGQAYQVYTTEKL